MDDLLMCSACARHLRRDEARCPFCGAPLSAEGLAKAPRIAPPGLSRARLYAFHAAVATGVAATSCGSNTTPAASPDAAIDRSVGHGPNADASGDAATGADATLVAEASADATPAGDATGDATLDANDAADANMRDWGPIPLPYGCVFPGHCDGVKV
jgi:hypothetical protein